MTALALLTVAIILGWGVTYAKLQDRIKQLELELRASRASVDDLGALITAKWATRDEFLTLIAAQAENAPDPNSN